MSEEIMTISCLWYKSVWISLIFCKERQLSFKVIRREWDLNQVWSGGFVLICLWEISTMTSTVPIRKTTESCSTRLANVELCWLKPSMIWKEERRPSFIMEQNWLEREEYVLIHLVTVPVRNVEGIVYLNQRCPRWYRRECWCSVWGKDVSVFYIRRCRSLFETLPCPLCNDCSCRTKVHW